MVVLFRMGALLLLHVFEHDELKNKSIMSIQMSIGKTYTSVIKIFNRFEKCGIVTTHKKGRIRIVRLTEKGKVISKHIQYLYNRGVL